jgi:ribosomal protein S11
MFLFIYIKVLRGNFFLLISNKSGELVFNKSCGNLGFKNIQKRSKEAFQNLLLSGIQYVLNLGNTYKLFISIDGAKKINLQLIYTKFISILKLHLRIFAVRLINKVSHNGCRQTYFRK